MRRIRLHLLLLLLPLAAGCAAVTTVRNDAEAIQYAAADRHAGPPEARLAPAFLIRDPDRAYNRIGTIVAERGPWGQELLRADPDRPAIYVETRDFATERGRYRNYIYRVHFPATPYNLLPFTLGAGANPGLLVILTTDEAGRPLLFTQTGTCGCYVAVIPTDLLPPEKRPEGWGDEPLAIYGETLPSEIALSGLDHPRIVVEVRPGEHRVMDVRAISDPPGAEPIPGVRRIDAPLLPEADLDRIPFEGGTTSLYHPGPGPAKGHVKGAFRLWETLLMGWWSLDFYVGMDKDYGYPGNPFYTSLKPWARSDSDMADFAGFLKYWGWRL